jgi:predicted ATPase
VRDKLIESRNGRWLLTVQAEKLDAWKSASLRQLIEGQLSRLPAGEQRLLEAAATVGAEFASDLLAAALESDPVEVEERCDGLVRRRQVIRMAPEGSVQRTGEHPRYEFLHDLYRSAAFDRSSQGRRRHWYQRIGGKLALDAGDQVDTVATELAYYFEQAGMPAVAAQYCAVAGERAARQFAHSEALGQFRRGLDLLKSVSATNERDAIELRVQVGLADLLVALQGHRSHEVVAALSRARELNEKLGDAPQSFAALRGLYELLIGRPDYEGTLELCDKMDRVARRENDSYVVAEALRLRGLSTFFLGRLRESQKALAESIAAYNRGAPTSKVCGIWKEPLATSASVLALASAPYSRLCYGCSAIRNRRCFRREMRSAALMLWARHSRLRSRAAFARC